MTVGWGFLGAGRIATHLAGVVAQAESATLVRVGASDPDRAATLGQPGSYEDVLDDPRVAVVYIALANHQHRPWTMRALAAGKHVLCEKPLGLSLGEARSLAEAAEGRLVEASFYRWHPLVAQAQALLDDIGPVEHVEGGFCFSGVPRSDYRMTAAYGGGASLDVGCYPVSAALWAAGPVQSVSARSRTVGDVDVATTYRLEHVSGATSDLVGSMDDPPRCWLVITGARGEIELRGHAFTGTGEARFGDGRGTRRLAGGGGGGYAAMVDAVSGWAAGGDDWVLPLEDSLACAAVLDAAAVSAASGAAVVALHD
ncbi:MAG TPA: Gfo/Idh/MocA family oxidoreductase [Mycobacteriales bacterium]